MNTIRCVGKLNAVKDNRKNPVQDYNYYTGVLMSAWRKNKKTIERWSFLTRGEYQGRTGDLLHAMQAL